MSSFDGPVCLFCNDGESDSEVVRLTLAADWAEGTGTYWCHGSCLQSATHPSVPLYLLGLRRDEAVYGTNQRRLADGEDPGERSMTEREAFRAARNFIEQFNSRENSDALQLLVNWMAEGLWDQDPFMTTDPAQWHDWVGSVDRVIVDRGEGLQGS